MEQDTVDRDGAECGVNGEKIRHARGIKQNELKAREEEEEVSRDAPAS